MRGMLAIGKEFLNSSERRLPGKDHTLS